MTQDRTKLWYLKNLDIFSHLRNEEHEMIEKASIMHEMKKRERLYLQGGVMKIIKKLILN